MNRLCFLILFIIAYMALTTPAIAQNNNSEVPISKEEAKTPQAKEQKEKDGESTKWRRLRCWVFTETQRQDRCANIKAKDAGSSITNVEDDRGKTERMEFRNRAGIV